MQQYSISETLANARAALLAEQTPQGYWVGELSASALSTATAIFTLSTYRQQHHDRPELDALIHAGLCWLVLHQNSDGGWGDTILSFSNISTTCLCWAALNLPEASEHIQAALRAEGWIRNSAGTLEPQALAKTIADRYGKDRTFSVPILTMLALANRLGPHGWKLVPQLPFELAALPHWCFQIMQLPVVSYALPALIAIGQVKHALRPTWNPITRILRFFTKNITLRKLRAIQPTTGGYLEATPLTSFVCMSLIGAGQAKHDIVKHGLDFLVSSARSDGGWPIDTNLTTWVTTLSVNALGELPPHAEAISTWLLDQQYKTIHPFTMAAPGGWAWTDLSGGVPDADDTPSALLALAKLAPTNDNALSAASAGSEWLLNLQNRDGGIPTFCRGWTGLPFDRSSNDLTAHAIRAWAAWCDRVPAKLQMRIDRAVQNGLAYLIKTQRTDGAWAPLWFGNQHASEIENLTYGTSRVLKLREVASVLKFSENMLSALQRGAEWLVQSQNADGGWGGRCGTPSSIDETGLALDGLVALLEHESQPNWKDSAERAAEYLAFATTGGTRFPASPIGFYFANLWYYEKLYPLIFVVAALTRFDNLE